MSCESSPCTNGATCVDVNIDAFICVCRGGFFGVTCENSEYSVQEVFIEVWRQATSIQPKIWRGRRSSTQKKLRKKMRAKILIGP